MNLSSTDNFLNIALNAALIAGEEIRKIYFSDQLMVEYKNDLSPITLADRRSHECIEEVLSMSLLPVLSEEGTDIDFETRKNWNLFWMVDPLDGTREFVKRNDDFTVNIALIQNQEPVLGVIYAPINGLLYFGIKGMGSFKHDTFFEKTITPEEQPEFISNSKKLPLHWPRKKFTIAVSKSHMNQKTLDFVNEMIIKFGDVETISVGSSLKICLVSEGKADIYPRYGKTMEWDTAAGHAIASSAGFSFTLTDGESSLRYNKPDLTNPFFLVKHHSLVI